MEFKPKKCAVIFVLFLLLTIITLSTKFYGITDLGDYVGVAKYFAGDYSAKIRPSHSISFGLVNSPLVNLTSNLFLFKVVNLIWLFLIIYSVYFISDRNKRTLLLFILSPIVWYIAPFLGPIQLASLLFLWGFYFIRKFEKTEKVLPLLISGTLMGLAAIFWNTALFLIFLMAAIFFYNKKVHRLILFILALVVGFLPLLITDWMFYGVPFYSFVKFGFATLSFPLIGGIYSNGTSLDVLMYIAVLIFLPLYLFNIVGGRFFKENKKVVIFLILGYLFVLGNPQPRYLFFLWPILILYLEKTLDDKQFRRQNIIFAIVSLIVVMPYIIQIPYGLATPELSTMITLPGEIRIMDNTQEEILLENLDVIVTKYPNEVIVVGNGYDDYEPLARAYWGDEIKELVSIQDYVYWRDNRTEVWSKVFMPSTKLNERRQVWMGGGVNKKSRDETDYEKIWVGIGVGEPLKLEGFEFVEKYGPLYVSEKTKSALEIE
jgi:hypothetical protein